MSDQDKGAGKKAEGPVELTEQEMQQASGGKARAPKTIYDEPGSKFE